MEQSTGTRSRRHTRLQEKKHFEKCYEENFGKKLRKTEMTHDNSRGSYQANRKEEGGKRETSSKRSRVSEGSAEPEEDIIFWGDEPRRGSMRSTKNKGLKEKQKSGDDFDNAILAEEVVSNHNSSRVPSSLGSGMNSGCAGGEKTSRESPEVVSSSFRREGECILLSDDSSESGGQKDEDDRSSELDLPAKLDNDDPDDEDCKEGFENGVSVTSIGEEEDENEDENDDAGIDGGICVSSKGKSNVVEEVIVDDQFCGDGNDGESSETLKEGKQKERKRKRKQVIEDGLIRQKIYGLDVLSTCNNKGDNMDKSIANRLRSRSRLLSNSKRKKLELGTISRPLVVDEKLESSSDSEDKRPPVVKYNSESESESKSESSSDTEDMIESSTDSEDMFGPSSQEDRNVVCKNKVKIDRKDIRLENRKRKDIQMENRKDIRMENRKRNDIRMENRKTKKKKRSTSNSPDLEMAMSQTWQETFCSQEKIHGKLPLKFTFEDENPVLQEKEDWEKENEALFDRMELSLKAIEIGSLGPSMDDSSETKASAIVLCRKGKHNLKLEEDIGLICINCPYVLEMKYIFPEFAKDPFKRWEKKCLLADGEKDCSFVDRLKFQNWSSKCNSSSDNLEGTVWDLVPGMKEKMYAHQHEGFEFIWKLLAGGISLEKLNLCESLSDERNGCIINHAPGTGKTCLVIVFLLSFMKRYSQCRPLIVVPRIILRNWESEFKKWNVNLPFYNLNNDDLSPKEHEKATEQFGHVLRDINCSRLPKWCSRLFKLCFWKQEPSVLAMSYPLFVKLAGEQGKTKIPEQNEKAKIWIRKSLLGDPDILVLDEGHTARNIYSQTLNALSEVKTKRRIILSGTLFQNNFNELSNTLRLVNPRFADLMDKSRGCTEEELFSLTNSIVWKGGDGDNLKEMNHKFVHVYKGDILLQLPGIKDCRIDLRPTELQAKLLNKLVKVPENFRRNRLMSLISIHPSLVSDSIEFSHERCELEELGSNPDGGGKTLFVLELIRLCAVLRERVLIFCQYLDPFKLIMNQLKSKFNWVEDREVLQMDGNAGEEKRNTVIMKMNDPDSEVRVLLASTKACNEGINLVGASRVVFLDVVYNPSVETQAISRAYRIGQKKVVYVYHLITSDSSQVDNYHSQNYKEHISKLVFSSKNKHCGSNGETVNPQAAVLEDEVLETMLQHPNLKNMLDQIYELPRID